MVEPICGAPVYFACHLLSETLVHGHDLARARGIPWQVEDAHAALVVRGLMLPVLAAMSARRPVSRSGHAPGR